MSKDRGPHISEAEVPKMVEAIALTDGDSRRDLMTPSRLAAGLGDPEPPRRHRPP